VVLVACERLWPSLSAQNLPDRDLHARPASVFYLGINIAVATISAFVHGRHNDASIERTLLAGAAGGTLMYAGQRMVGTREPALRLAGVQTVAVGANVARNVASGARPVSSLTLPLFPFYLTIQPGQPRVRLRLSTAAVVGIINLSGHGRKFEFTQSLYSGALVFSQNGHQVHCYDWDGDTCMIARVAEHQIGSVAYATDPRPSNPERVLAHEFGHITQDVRDVVLNAVPMSDYVLGNSGSVGRFLANYIVIDVFLPLMAASDILGPPSFDHACRNMGCFYECEAYALIR
jgi:hypothetical protein